MPSYDDPQGFDPHGFLHRWERTDPQFHRALMRAMANLWDATDLSAATPYYYVWPAADPAGHWLRIRGWSALVYFVIDPVSNKPMVVDVLYSPDSRPI